MLLETSWHKSTVLGTACQWQGSLEKKNQGWYRVIRDNQETTGRRQTQTETRKTEPTTPPSLCTMWPLPTPIPSQVGPSKVHPPSSSTTDGQTLIADESCARTRAGADADEDELVVFPLETTLLFFETAYSYGASPALGNCPGASPAFFETTARHDTLHKTFLREATQHQNCGSPRLCKKSVA